MTTRGVTSLVLLTLAYTACLMDTEESYGEYPEDQTTGFRAAPLHLQTQGHRAGHKDGRDQASHMGHKEQSWHQGPGRLARPTKKCGVGGTDQPGESPCPFGAWEPTASATSPEPLLDPTPEPATPSVIPASTDSPPE